MVVWWVGVAVVLAVAWLLPDLVYFLRFGAMALRALCLLPRTRLLQTTCYRSMCAVEDCGPEMWCMRPARYWRELDFARYHFYMRCGLFSEIMLRRGGAILQGACSLRYCQDIPTGHAYRIETQLVHWDERSLYLRQRFVREKDEVVCAVCLSKQSVTGASVEECARSASNELVQKPGMDPDLVRWIQSMEASSCKLRPPAPCSTSSF